MLTKHSVIIQPQIDGKPGMLVLKKGDYFDTVRIPVVVRKSLLHRFKRKFGVPIEAFFEAI